MAPLTYRLPNDTIPVLLSAETRELLRYEAVALLSYAADHPEVTPDRIAEMLFRTRIARRHQALAMVTQRDELISALHAVIDEHEHPSLVRTNTPASTRRLAYVFPGQEANDRGWGGSFTNRYRHSEPRQIAVPRHSRRSSASRR